MIRFLCLCLTARLRGLAYEWPHQPPTPPGYTTVSCACRAREVYGFYRLRWIPFVFHNGGGGMNRLFLVKDEPDLAAYEAAAMADMIRIADEYDAERRVMDAMDDYFPVFSEAVDRALSRVPDDAPEHEVN